MTARSESPSRAPTAALLALAVAATSVLLAAYVTLAPVVPGVPWQRAGDLVTRDVETLRAEVECDPCAATDVAEKAIRGLWSIRPQTAGRVWPDVNAPLDDIWAGDQVRNRTYRYNLHSLFLLRHLIRAHQWQPQSEYLNVGKRIVLSWIRSNPLDKPPCPFSWNDHATANRAISLCAFADYLDRCSVLDDETREELRRALHTHGEWLSSPLHYTFRHNHGIFQDQALIVAATHLAENPTTRRWIRIALRRLDEQIADTYSPTGMHLENAPYYHVYVTDLLGRLHDYLSAVEVKRTQRLKKTLAMAREAYPFFVMPNHEIVPVGDSPRGGPAPTAPDERSLAVYADAGYAALRGELCIFFAASNHSWSHKHCDDLSIVVADAGGPVISDPGFLNYEGNDAEREFSLSWDAHSTVTSSPGSPLAVSRCCGIDAFGRAGGYACVRGRSKRADGAVHTRWVLHDTNSQTVVVFDRCEWERPVRWLRRFQFEPDITLAQAAPNRLEATTGGRTRLRLTVWPPDPNLTITFGQTEPRQGWVCQPFQGLVPAPATTEVGHGRIALFAAALTAKQEHVGIVVEGSDTLCIKDDTEVTRIHLLADRVDIAKSSAGATPSGSDEAVTPIPLTRCELHRPYGKFWPLGWDGRVKFIALAAAVWLPALGLAVGRVRRSWPWLATTAVAMALMAGLLILYWPRICFTM